MSCVEVAGGARRRAAGRRENRAGDRQAQGSPVTADRRVGLMRGALCGPAQTAGAGSQYEDCDGLSAAHDSLPARAPAARDRFGDR